MRKGLSLFELLLVIGGLSMVCCLGWVVLVPTAEEIGASAKRNALAFIAETGLDATGVTCSQRDSDQDGYVSCTVVMGDSTMRAIECGYDRPDALKGQNTGCRMALPGNIVQGGE